jgi:hypothetical protein
MIEAADAVLLLSKEAYGGRINYDECYAIWRPKLCITPPTGSDVKPYWLREALEEVSA